MSPKCELNGSEEDRESLESYVNNLTQIFIEEEM